MGRITQTLKITNKVHVYRAEKRLTQGQLAEAISVTRATINAIESNNYNPSLELAFRLARFFDVSLETLFSAEDKGEQT